MTSGYEVMPFVRLGPLIDSDDPADVGSNIRHAAQAECVFSSRACNHDVSTDSIARQAPVWDIELDLGDGLRQRLLRGH